MPTIVVPCLMSDLSFSPFTLSPHTYVTPLLILLTLFRLLHYMRCCLSRLLRTLRQICRALRFIRFLERRYLFSLLSHDLQIHGIYLCQDSINIMNIFWNTCLSLINLKVFLNLINLIDKKYFVANMIVKINLSLMLRYCELSTINPQKIVC